MDLKKQLDEARKAFNTSLRRLQELQEEYRKTVEDPEMRAMVGKCFKYATYYDGVERHVYLRVFDAKDDGLMALFFKRFVKQDHRGTNQIEDVFLGYPLSSDYIPITEAEYRAAVEPILDTIRERAGL